MLTGTAGPRASLPAMTPGFDPPPPDPMAYVSIVVPIRNEARYITSTLTQIAGLNYPRDRLEVLVVDGQSTDATPDLVRAFAVAHPDLRLSLQVNPRRLSSAARNLGVRAARGDYVLIIDGHVEIPNRNLLLDALAIIDRHGPLALGRPQRLSPTGLTATQELIAATRACPIGHALDSHIYADTEGWTDPSSIAVMYHRCVFDKVGLFDETFDAAEDLEFNTRLAAAGVRCYTSPKLEVHYFPRETHAALARQMARYGLGRARLWRKLGRVPSVAALAPAALVAGLVLLPFLLAIDLVTHRPVFTDLGAAALLAYGGLTALVYRRDPALTRFGYVAFLRTILTVHLGIGTGIWQGWLSPRRA